MQRISTWEEALNAYLAEPMDFGANLPCAFFAAGAVQAMTGQDLAARLRSKSGLAASLRKHQAEGDDFLEAVLGETLLERSLGFARTGDVLLHDGCLGICLGADGIFWGQEGDGPEGLVRVPLAQCEKAWAV